MYSFAVLWLPSPASREMNSEESSSSIITTTTGFCCCCCWGDVRNAAALSDYNAALAGFHLRYSCYCGSRLWLLLAVHVLVLALPLLPSVHRMQRSLRPRGASGTSCTCYRPPPSCRCCSARSTSAVAARWKVGGLASLSYRPGQHSSRSSA